MIAQKPYVRVAFASTPSAPETAGRESDKLIPLIADSAEMSRSWSLGVPSVRERIERFVGV
jgi:hypothetical protein